MSEQKIISPLLDGFSMGNPLGDHDGVRCCPAIKENTEKQYIVKIISVPATQRQMDALLLAGAYKDPSGAMEYYKELAEDICKEAELLQTLSRLEGFLPYEGWQVEPITRKRLGYEVYLLGSYKRSLEKHLRRNPVTHLEAMNLGLDLCSALNVCRQAGYLYVDLKPSNVFVSEKKEYRIGDLGFIALDALSYSALPSKYHSVYTPPEFGDPMAPLNTTADTYALGLMLYQIYNDGQLPPKAEPEEMPAAPVNADYELAEILLTAIHQDPNQRWQDPASMGQALASYMQRNVINDVPITPHVPLETEEPALKPEDSPSDLNEDGQGQDETSPGETDAQLLQPHEMSDELSKIVSKADDLIAHETPEGVVVPEAPELPDPFAFADDEEEAIDDGSIPLDPLEKTEADVQPEETVPPAKKKQPRFISPEIRRRRRRILLSLVCLVALAVAAVFGYIYYQEIYLQPVYALTVQGAGRDLTVTVDTDVDPSGIRVQCADSYGNVRTESIRDGLALFRDLLPYTEYTISLSYDGFHRLVGETTQTFQTEAESHIVSFTAVTGPEDGSVVLNFTVDGEEPRDWTVLCSAPGENDQRHTFSGHSTTIKGLTVGTQYTFSLLPEEDLTVGGETSLTFLVSRVILAEDIYVTSDNGTDLTVRWSTPGDLVISSWDVFCYNNRGYEERFTTEAMEVLIPDLDLSADYTIEITAAGMTQPARFTLRKNPVHITQLTLSDPEKPGLEELKLNWQFVGEAPAGGWLVMYTMDGSATASVIKCEKQPSAVIGPLVPGTKYRILIQAADGASVLNSVYHYNCPEAEAFDTMGLTEDSVTVQTLSTPEAKDWRYETIQESDFTDTFLSGENISLVLRTDKTFYLPGTKFRVLYVYRSAHGTVLPDLVRQEEIRWKDIWTGGDVKAGELDVPTAPTAPGKYTLELYIEGMVMAKLPITIR